MLQRWKAECKPEVVTKEMLGTQLPNMTSQTYRGPTLPASGSRKNTAVSASVGTLVVLTIPGARARGRKGYDNTCLSRFSPSESLVYSFPLIPHKVMARYGGGRWIQNNEMSILNQASIPHHPSFHSSFPFLLLHSFNQHRLSLPASMPQTLHPGTMLSDGSPFYTVDALSPGTRSIVHPGNLAQFPRAQNRRPPRRHGGHEAEVLCTMCVHHSPDLGNQGRLQSPRFPT